MKENTFVDKHVIVYQHSSFEHRKKASSSSCFKNVDILLFCWTQKTTIIGRMFVSKQFWGSIDHYRRKNITSKWCPKTVFHIL